LGLTHLLSSLITKTKIWCTCAGPAATQECTNSRSDELVEHVPEALKNTLMVMHGSGVLVPSWKVSRMSALCLATRDVPAF
jgi:hypothetical protein